MGPARGVLLGVGCAWLSLSAAPSVAEPPLHVRFVMDWAFEGAQAIWTVADSSGCFARAGLDVTIERSYGSGDSVVKVASGSYDIGVADFSTMVGFDGKNPDRRLTAIFMISDRAPMSIVSLKASHITKPQDLVGKRLADGVSEASRVMFPAFAKANGFDPDSVKWVTTTPDLRQQLLVRDQTDAAAGHMFTILTGLQAIGVKQQDTSVMLYDNWGVHFFGNALVTTPAWAQAHPAAAKAFVVCAVEGIKLSMTEPNVAIASLRPKNTLLNEPIELASLAFSNSVAIETPNTVKNGLSAVTNDRLVDNIEEASAALGVPAPKADDVWTDAYLPPRDTLALPK